MKKIIIGILALTTVAFGKITPEIESKIRTQMKVTTKANGFDPQELLDIANRIEITENFKTVSEYTYYLQTDVGVLVAIFDPKAKFVEMHYFDNLTIQDLEDIIKMDGITVTDRKVLKK
jgi:hypothetical protein